MILPLLLAVAVPQTTALDAERAFDRAAARKGQWTAFREFAAPDAIMFVPERVEAQEWLKNRKDPPKTVRWQPTASYLSCDGKTAVNTGNWQRPDGSTGYFTTVWGRQFDGRWKWLLDSGDVLPKARAAVDRPLRVRANCHGGFFGPIVDGPRPGSGGLGRSPDNTLQWNWELDAKGGRMLDVSIIVGSAPDHSNIRHVIHDVIAAQ